MQTWKVVTTAGVSSLSIIAVVVLILRLCGHCRAKRPCGDDPSKAKAKAKAERGNGRQGRLYSELQKVGSDKSEHSLSRQDTGTIRFRRAIQSTKFFNWTENPHLMIDAVENGWKAFAFYFVRPQASSISSKWCTCAQCGERGDLEPQITWEIGNGADYMQSIRLNPEKNLFEEKSVSSLQILLSALPLPGPPLGRHSYPQQAYFELTIVAQGCQQTCAVPSDLPLEHEAKNCKSISSAADAVQSMAASNRSSPGAMIYGGTEHQYERKSREDQKLQLLISSQGHEESQLIQNNSQTRHESRILAIGLSASEFPAAAPPGSHLGSIGFYSDGRILLDAKPCDIYDGQHTTSSKTRAWGGSSTTVGCGFNPKEQRVFFTLNGYIVSDVRSLSPDFSYPLHACIGSNHDATLVVNFGQSSFLYVQANEHRAPDPGNNRPPNPRSSKSNHLMYEDSAELFSMGRRDSWVELETSPLSQDLQQRHLYSEVETDLFEIALEGGKSGN